MSNNALTAEPLVKRALSAHSAIGVAIGVVLYLICLSGTLMVFHDEIEHLEQRGEPHVSSIAPAAVQRAAEVAMSREPDTTHLFMRLPTDGFNRVWVQTDNQSHYADAAGEFAAEPWTPWSDFLLNLHYYLHLPTSFGMILVALFGVFLFAMSLTGLLAHPKIFKEAFTFRRFRSRQLRETDLHNRLSVWTAPFHIVVGLTGAFIGLASVSALAIGSLHYEGDAAAVFEPVFGSEPVVDAASAPLARIDLALAYMDENHADKPIIWVILHDPGTAGQYLQFMAEHPRRLIYAEKYNFNGEAEFLGTVGSADGAAGQQIADSVYKVHFGSFGGLPVKLTYSILGFVLLWIIAAGMKIYFLRRAARGRPIPALERAWRAVLWGAPALMLAAFLLAIGFPELGRVITPLFWWGLLGLVLLNMIAGHRLRAGHGNSAEVPGR